MNRWFKATTLVALLVLFAACSFDAVTSPIGLPTVSLSVDNVQMSSDGTQTSLSFTINAYTLPGSPAGTIVTYTFSDGTALSGPRVEACPATATTDCGPYAVDFSATFAGTLPPEGLSIVSYVVVGQNGASATRTLPEPIVVVH